MRQPRAAAAAMVPAWACTRAVYLGDNGDVITARSMDWKVDVATNLYVLPRGIERTGQAGPKSAKGSESKGEGGSAARGGVAAAICSASRRCIMRRRGR